MGRLLQTSGALLVLMLFASPAAAQSFCDTAGHSRNLTERTICANGFLVRLDMRLNRAYRDFGAHFHGAALNNLRNEQRAWLRSRNACGGSVSCIASAYQDRLSELEGRPASTSTQQCPHGYEFVNGSCLPNDELTGDPCGPGFEQVPQTDACISVTVAQDNRRLPMSGQSFGGIVRAQPSMQSRRVGSLNEGEHVILLRNTGDRMGQYDWYQIQYRGGRIAYQWGGILCSNQHLAGILSVCR